MRPRRMRLGYNPAAYLRAAALSIGFNEAEAHAPRILDAEAMPATVRMLLQ